MSGLESAGASLLIAAGRRFAKSTEFERLCALLADRFGEETSYSYSAASFADWEKDDRFMAALGRRVKPPYEFAREELVAAIEPLVGPLSDRSAREFAEMVADAIHRDLRLAKSGDELVREEAERTRQDAKRAIETLKEERATAGEAQEPDRGRRVLDEAGLHVWSDSDPTWATRRAERPDDRSSQAESSQDLRREFHSLILAFDSWLRGEQRKRGAGKVRAYWLVGAATANRERALLACLAHVHALDRAVGEAGHDLPMFGNALEHCMRRPALTPPPVIGVDLLAKEAEETWRTVEDRVTSAMLRTSQAAKEYPLVLLAGTEQQAGVAHDALKDLFEFQLVDLQGGLQPRPRLDGGRRPKSPHVLIQGLPMTAPKLFGRATPLAKIRDAWTSEQTHIMSIVAFGGAGKSALVNQWLRDMETHDFLEADRVLAWSFYSQGTRDNLVSADDFVTRALDWLGHRSPMTLSAAARGYELASLIKRHRFLLVLDGMEPLQYPSSAREVGGRLTDDSMHTLLQELAKDDWSGLCLITTRVPLTDLSPYEAADSKSRTTVTSHRLDKLPLRAAGRLLEHLLRRRWPAEQLEEVAKSVDRHALAITLLGNYLRDVYGGDLAHAVDIERLTVDAEQGGHARRIMATYARFLKRRRRPAELAILRLIGLFDRPARPDAMGALLADPQLGSLTRKLDRVGDDKWNGAVEALRSIGLLNEPDAGSLGTIDAHPLVREHFRDELHRQPDRVWTQANDTLFRYYRDVAEPQPRDHAGMQPLYAAVTHGCEAGLHQRAFDEILLPRIWQGRRTNYSTRRLGLTGADIVALSNYFDHRDWAQLGPFALSSRARVLVRTNAGVRLRQLGRLQNARECFGGVIGAIDLDQAAGEELEDASYAAAQSCELLVIAGRLVGDTGDVDTALVAGERAVAYADRGEDAYFNMHARSSLAEVHFMLGDLKRAEALFEQAIAIERERRPEPPFLYSQSLYRYGYHLIETGRDEQLLAMERSDPNWGTWRTDGEKSSLLSKAIRLLIMGATRRSVIEGGHGTARLAEDASELLDRALLELRTAGYPDYIVRGLLERARFQRVRRSPEDYRRTMDDLDRAELETERGQMALLNADVQLERAACELGFWTSMTRAEQRRVGDRVATTLAGAARAIEEISYHRRDGLLAQLQARAAAAPSRHETSTRATDPRLDGRP